MQWWCNEFIHVEEGIITKWNDPLIKHFEISKFWWREWAKKNWTREKDKKKYYLLVEKTTLYDHRNLKKNGDYKCSNHMLSYQQPSYTHFFQFALLLKTAIFFFKNNPAFFKKSLLKKTHTFFFLFPFDSVAFRKFYLQKMKNCPKKFTKHFSSSKLTFKIYKIVLVFF